MTEPTSQARPLNYAHPPGQSPPAHPAHATSGGGKWVVILLLLIAAGTGAYFYFGRSSSSSSGSATRPGADASGGRPQTLVVVAEAEQGDMPVYLTGLGSVSPLNVVTVRSRVDGQLDKITFKEGQLVHQGDLLAEIDPRPFQVQVTQVSGQMARDQAQLENAKRDFQRYKEAGDAVTQQQLDTQAAVVAQFEGAVKTDQGQIDNAKLQLSYCQITAPLDGTVGLRIVDPGNMIHATDPAGLVVITQLQPIAVLFSLPAENVAAVVRKMHGEGALAVDAFDREARGTPLATGVVSAIDNQIDQSTGTVRVKATFENKNNALYPNQFVNARLLIDVKRGTTIVPAAAVQRGPNKGAFVYVLQPDKTVKLKTDIVVGPSDEDKVSIEKGLAPGDVVVTDGVDKLKDGAKVNASFGGSTTRGSTTRPTMRSTSGPSTNPSTGPATDDAGPTTRRHKSDR